MVNIIKKGNFYYVEDDDCYIFYYLLKYKIKNNKCYFRKKYLDKILFTLSSKDISFQVKQYVYVQGNNYNYYLKLGKEKMIFDESLWNIKNKLLEQTENKNFNKIYNKIIEVIYE